MFQEKEKSSDTIKHIAVINTWHLLRKLIFNWKTIVPFMNLKTGNWILEIDSHIIPNCHIIIFLSFSPPPSSFSLTNCLMSFF